MAEGRAGMTGPQRVAGMRAMWKTCARRVMSSGASRRSCGGRCGRWASRPPPRCLSLGRSWVLGWPWPSPHSLPFSWRLPSWCSPTHHEGATGPWSFWGDYSARRLLAVSSPLSPPMEWRNNVERPACPIGGTSYPQGTMNGFGRQTLPTLPAALQPHAQAPAICRGYAAGMIATPRPANPTPRHPLGGCAAAAEPLSARSTQANKHCIWRGCFRARAHCEPNAPAHWHRGDSTTTRYPLAQLMPPMIRSPHCQSP